MASILAVDDEPRIRDVIKQALTAQGHNVTTASSGEECLKKANKIFKQPHVIILDIGMEGISGIETLRRLKANPKTCAIPVIMLTGLDDDETMQEAMGNYALEFLAKPMSMSDLAEKVEHVLNNQP
ncbi:hypothetical protein BVX97_03730 [bacterium E08(2017)]|nr:hypothetical protein BVX97_03730 [bacterium E08(2017)]